MLSTTSGTPRACAAAAMGSMSRMSPLGLGIDSPKKQVVVSSAAAVQEAGSALPVDEDVRGGEVAVDHAVGVRVLEGVCDLREHAQAFVDVDASVGGAAARLAEEPRGFLRAQGGRGVNGRRRVMRGEPLPALFGLFVADGVKRAVVAGVVAGAGVPPEDELHGRLL